MKVLKFIGLLLLWILKIIGFILGFILLVILLLLFVPFRYKAEGSFDQGVSVKVHFSWLLYFINGFYEKGEEEDVTLVRIWFIKVYDSRKKAIKDEKKAIKDEKKAKKEKKKADQEIKKSDKKRPKTQKALEGPKEYSTRVKEEDLKEPVKEGKKEDKKEDKPEEAVKTSSEAIQREPAQKPKQEEKTSEAPKKKTQEVKKEKKAKKEKAPNPTLVKAKAIWAFLQEPENEGLLKFITKYVVKTLKWILPKEVWISMEIGLEDPALTGYIAGVTSILYVKTRRHIHVVPNFTDQVIHGSFKVKGRLFLYQPLYYIIRVILSKRVRRLYKLAKG